jgi:hypothetical protein
MTGQCLSPGEVVNLALDTSHPGQITVGDVRDSHAMAARSGFTGPP